MCLNPRHIVIKPIERLPFLDKRFLAPRDRTNEMPLPPLRREYSVPCGKCVECLRKRQYGYVQLCHSAAIQYGSMVFVTLTYDNERMPFNYRKVSFNPETGEYFLPKDELDGRAWPLEHLEKFYPNTDFRARVLKAYKSCDKWSPRIVDGADSMYMEVCPTTRREHVRLWLKRLRMEYHRKFGERLPEFKYICVAEHGHRTFRPHYHLAFFGLSVGVVRWLCSHWERDYGFCCIKDVPLAEKDLARVSHYISKYMCKGSYDVPFIADGIVEKPRIMISTHFTDVQRFSDYLHGRDFMPDAPSWWYDKDQLQRVQARQHYIIQGIPYPLGRQIKKLIFYHNEKEIDITGKVKYKSVPDSLQVAMSDFARLLVMERSDKDFRSFQAQLSSEDSFEVLESYKAYTISRTKDRAQSLEKQIISQYQKDLF